MTRRFAWLSGVGRVAPIGPCGDWDRQERGREAAPAARSRGAHTQRWSEKTVTIEGRAPAVPSHASARIPWAGAQQDLVVRALSRRLACRCRNRGDGSAGSEWGRRPRLLVRHARRRRHPHLDRHAASAPKADSRMPPYNDRMSRRSSPDHVDADRTRDARSPSDRERQAGRGGTGHGDDTQLEVRACRTERA